MKMSSTKKKKKVKKTIYIKNKKQSLPSNVLW